MIIWHSFFFLLFALIACTAAIAMVVSNNVVRMAFYLVISLGAVAGLYFLAGADFVGAMQLMIYVGGTLVLLIFGVMLTAQRPFVTMKTNPPDAIWAAIIGACLLAVLLGAAFRVDDWRVGREPESRHTVTRIGLGLLGVRVDELNLPAQADAKIDPDPTDKTPGLNLSIAAVSIAEDAKSPATTATVSRNTDITQPLVVRIAKDHASEVAFPARVTIPAGQTAVSFAINAVDDAIVDGSQTVTITATAPAHTNASQRLEVADDDAVGYLLPFEIISVHLLVVLIGAAYLARTRKHSRKPQA